MLLPRQKGKRRLSKRKPLVLHRGMSGTVVVFRKTSASFKRLNRQMERESWGEETS